MPPSLQRQHNFAKNAMLLATLDWVGAPHSVIVDSLRTKDGEEYAYVSLTIMRKTDEYREMIECLKKTWETDIATRVGSRDIRNAASAILVATLKRLMEIVCHPKTGPREIINAARLTAQMTGNIVVVDEGGERTTTTQETIAEELVTALNRMKADKGETVQ